MHRQAPFEPDFAIETSAAARGGTVIEVRGELDSGTCEELLEAFREIVAEHPGRTGATELVDQHPSRTGGPEATTPKVTLDLRNMTFIDSAGTRVLIMIERSAKAQGIDLQVTPPAEPVTELLRTAGLSDRIDLTPPTSSASGRAGGFIERTDFELPRDPHTPARARAEVRECIAAHDQSELANIVLLTSELVTNAVVHPRGVGQTPVGLRVINYEDGLRVEVEDAGDGFGQLPPVLPDAERGRGLFLVDRFADRWGSGHVQTAAGRRFRVWFEMDWEEQESREVA